MIQPPRIVPSQFDSNTFTVSVTSTTTDSRGFSHRGTPTTVPNVPGNLQPMSTTRRTTYKAESGGTLWDLYLPTHFAGSVLTIPVGHDFTASGGTVYRALGEGLPQGDSGRQLVPVERRDG